MKCNALLSGAHTWRIPCGRPWLFPVPIVSPVQTTKTEQTFCLLRFCVRFVRSEIIRPAEDEVAARHGVAAESCVTDGFVAFIGEVHALQVDLELLCDVIIDAEIER